ncbi:hypothetical protein FTO70_03500 [Methanosarcina sp. KYL-1]|uniref:hypothetical protein n=1 Tax=Methanosarcina sp. KYL-1 TaxID=2602068 RepID=UPI002100C388|nr:hypothetical protein [Methanosarcina sp. KYL-1]MCQ1534771.1 hypothetical protein [Methanosarcina sp. KYL-1]
MISILVCMLFLSSVCSGKELITEKQVITYHDDTFEDESENWKARYELSETHVFITANRKTHYDGELEHILFVTYKGNLSDLPSPKRINISYDAGSWGGGRVDSFNQEEYVFKRGAKRKLISERRPILEYIIDPVWIKEQKPIFEHTIGLICTSPNTVYIHHEASGGAAIFENDTVKVTVELDGQIETLELRSAQ